jgi:hypothetical protein
MKNKPNISEKVERPESLAVEPSKQPQAQVPAPTDEERKKNLAPWQLKIVALAEAHLSVDDEQDLVPNLLRRAIGLCRVVEDFSLVGGDNDLSMEALGKLMEVLEEEIQVVKWITSGRPLDPRWD